ncbi:MAG TPA: hypothetical protein PLF21_03325 [Exilispira sp.]|nr:hypothetical protein [Exilispira sp.]
MSKKSSKTILFLIIFIIILIFIFYFFTGFYIIPPGAINKGATHWFIRIGSGFPFLSSPSSILNKTKDFTSMKSNLKKVLNFPKDKVIATFKYSKWLYSFINK